MASTTLGDILLTIFPARLRGSMWRLSTEHVQIIAGYWAEWGRTHKRPSLALWALDHKFTIPPELSLPVVIKTEKSPPANVRQRDDRRIEKMIDKKIAAMKTEIVEIIGTKEPRKQIEAPARGRENDPRIFAIEKKVNAFIFAEPINARDTWIYLRSRFEARNGVAVMLHGSQTFPQWLRSEEWVDTFVNEYQGFLDELHDRLSDPKQGRLSI
jgi:hypothetical protein